MALAMNSNGDFYDDGQSTQGGSTGITYSGDTNTRSATEDGNAGEAAASDDWLSRVFEVARETTNGAADSVLDLFNPRADSVAVSMEATRAAQEAQPSSSANVIDRLLGGIGKAYDKDPLEFLKLGLGAVGGAYAADEKRKAADAAARAQLDQQNNAAAIEQAKKKAYTDSLRGVKPGTARTQAPLARIDGTRIYQNGVLKG